jgi:hypothetical protein
MALRTTGHKAEGDSYDTSSYNLSYDGVSSWAKGAVAVADKYQLLRSKRAVGLPGMHQRQESGSLNCLFA